MLRRQIRPCLACCGVTPTQSIYFGTLKVGARRPGRAARGGRSAHVPCSRSGSRQPDPVALSHRWPWASSAFGTGYLIWGPQELFHHPERDEREGGLRESACGASGCPASCSSSPASTCSCRPGPVRHVQDAGPRTWPRWRSPPTACTGFAIGWNRLHQADPRVNVGMAVAFTLISILGIIAFFSVGRPSRSPVCSSALPASTWRTSSPRWAPTCPRWPQPAERALGFFRIGNDEASGFMYLTFAVALNFVLGYTLPL